MTRPEIHSPYLLVDQIIVAEKIMAQHDAKVIDVVLIMETPTGRSISVESHCHITGATRDSCDDLVEIKIEGKELLDAIEVSQRDNLEKEKKAQDAIIKQKKWVTDTVTESIDESRKDALILLGLTVIFNAVVTLAIILI